MTNMTDKQITTTWQAAGSNNSGNSPFNGFDPKRRTALDRLADKYRRFYTMALVMAPVSLMLFGNSHMMPDLRHRILVGVTFFIYFFICFLMDRYLYHGIRDIDCYTMTVRQVTEKALKLKKFHLRGIMYLLPMALFVFGLLLYMFDFEFYFTLGVCAGALVGGAIGFYQYKEFMKEYHTLIDD